LSSCKKIMLFCLFLRLAGDDEAAVHVRVTYFEMLM
jgi:hypothetical protein